MIKTALTIEVMKYSFINVFTDMKFITVDNSVYNEKLYLSSYGIKEAKNMIFVSFIY